eukprot:Hpha_TRINITY_DN3286_c0_g2::TRINITY_DN3286_c0_g2_i1::g.185986::m.185986
MPTRRASPRPGARSPPRASVQFMGLCDPRNSKGSNPIVPATPPPQALDEDEEELMESSGGSVFGRAVFGNQVTNHSGCLDAEELEGVLTTEEEEGYKKLFSQLDATMDGTIAVQELVHACGLLQVKMPRAEIESHFEREDEDHDGRLSIQEFITFFAHAKKLGAVNWSPERLQWVVSQVLTQRLLNDNEMTRRRDLIRSASSGDRSVVDDHRLRWLFDTMRLTAGIYYGVMVPMHTAMGAGHFWYDDYPALLIVEVIITVFANIDVILGPRRHKNVVVVDLRRASFSPFKRYILSQRFVTDAMAGFPIDLVGYAVGSAWLHTAGYFLRLAAMAKFNSLFQLGRSSLVTADSARWVFELA